MRRLARALQLGLGLGVAALSSVSCIGTTEGGLVSFHAAAAGPADANGGALSFRTRSGFDVTLRKANLHVGAVYLNRTVPLSSERASSCVLPTTYVAQVLSAVDVSLLDSAPVAFPSEGTGLQDLAVNGEVWLTGTGNVNAAEDKTTIFGFEGDVTTGGVTRTFRGSFTIGANRAQPPQSTALPGSNPICQQRIVTGIPMSLQMREGGTLLLRADPREVFDTVDFAQLVTDADGVLEFANDDVGQPDVAAYNALRASNGVYTFSFVDAP